MSTIAKEEISAEVRRQVSSSPRRQLPWLWILAVITALAVGLLVGATGWQALHRTSTSDSTSSATAVTRHFAQRFIAADPVLHASRVPEFYAPNVVWVDATLGDIFRGRAGVVEANDVAQFPNMKIKATLVYVGPDTFIVDRRMTASSSPMCATPVSFPSVEVDQVKNGLITRETAWWDTSSAFHCTSTFPTSPTLPK